MKKLLTEWRKFLKEGAVEKEISKTLSDEGGASGLDPLHKAAKKVEKNILNLPLCSDGNFFYNVKQYYPPTTQ